MEFKNGSLHSMKEDISFIKTNLSNSIEGLEVSIGQLATAIERLGDKIEISIESHKRSLPLPLVVLMFATMLGVIFGVEIFKFFLGKGIGL